MSTIKANAWKNQAGTREYFPCTAWVNWNGTGTVAIRASGNVSAITDNGLGDYTVNFGNTMDNANYCVGGSGSQVGTGNNGDILSVLASSPPTTSAVRVRIQEDNSGVTDSEFASCTIFGGLS